MALLSWLKKNKTPQAVVRPQPDGSSHRRRGNAFLDQGRLDEAIACYKEAIAVNPDDADAHLNLGFVLGEQQRYDEADQSLRQSLSINPQQADAFYILGTIAKAQGNAESAVANLTRALELKPDFEIVYGDLCQLLHQERQLERAKGIIRKGLGIYPQKADFHVYLANLHAADGNLEQAISCFRKAVAIQPDLAQVHSSMGHLYRKSNRFADALASYDRVTALRPESAEAFNDRGIALGSLGRHEESLASFQRALEIDPQHMHALANLSTMLASLRRYDDAARSMAQLIEVAPEYPYGLGGMFGWKIHSCDWSQYESSLESIDRAVIQGKRAIQPFTLLAASNCPAAMLQCARISTADAYPPSVAPLWTGQRYAHDKIRVAYLSADFHDHATAYLMAELFELHDKERFEIAAISFGPHSDGRMRQRLRRSFNRFVDVRTSSDREVAILLREMEIDIAVDLKGFTTDGRPGILAQRPAPIQVNYLGFPGSMGADYVDYILADCYVIPAEQQDAYAEKVVWLPDSYQVNDSQRRIADRTPSRAECGLPASGFVFCCFNNNYKITPDVFDVWMRLLSEVAGSVLWLLEDNAMASRNLRAEAVRRGIAADRLVFAPRMELEEHLARHKLADLFLDTLPYNAHTTCSDALWAGLPVITCMGATFSSRVAASLLNAVGLAELVTDCLEDYEALCLKLASTPALLSDIRAKLWRHRSEYPLFDTKRFCGHIESAYTLMWERYQRDELPASFAVPPMPSA